MLFDLAFKCYKGAGFKVVDTFIKDDGYFEGKPQEFEQNMSMWIDIQELLKEEKILPVVKILEYLKNEDMINLNITCDKLNNVIKIETNNK